MTVLRRLHARRGDRGTERGSVSIWLALGSFVMIVVVGMAVDLSGQVLAQQHVRDVAREAARAGAQELRGPYALRGEGVAADPSGAVRAAQDYLVGTGVTGTPTVSGDLVMVTANDSYQPKFLGIIGIRSMPVSGEGEARVVRAVDGVER